MEYKVIDFDSWQRRPYFRHYHTDVPCTYSLTVKLDITGIRRCGVKLYPALLYAVATIIGRHEEFRTAFRKDGSLVVYDHLDPCYTIFHTDDESFSNLWSEYDSSWRTFLERYQEDKKEYGDVRGLEAKPDCPENSFPFSMIPWVSFDSFNLNLKKDHDYLIPIFTAGRFYEEGGRILIPLSLQVHHAVIDGYHASRFLSELQDFLSDVDVWKGR